MLTLRRGHRQFSVRVVSASTDCHSVNPSSAQNSPTAHGLERLRKSAVPSVKVEVEFQDSIFTYLRNAIRWAGTVLLAVLFVRPSVSLSAV